MVVWVVEISREGYKIRKMLGQNLIILWIDEWRAILENSVSKIEIIKKHWKFTLKVSTFSINLITHHFCQFTKYNNFSSGYWFFAKSLTNFVFLPWKLNNAYCHSALTTEWTDSFLHSEDIKLHVGFVIGLLNDHLIFYFYFYFYFLSKDS